MIAGASALTLCLVLFVWGVWILVRWLSFWPSIIVAVLGLALTIYFLLACLTIWSIPIDGARGWLAMRQANRLVRQQGIRPKHRNGAH
jgi:hypothetical protein